MAAFPRVPSTVSLIRLKRQAVRIIPLQTENVLGPRDESGAESYSSSRQAGGKQVGSLTLGDFGDGFVLKAENNTQPSLRRHSPVRLRKVA